MPLTRGVELVSVTVTRKNPNWLKELLERYRNQSVLAIGWPTGSAAVGLRYPDGTPVVLVAAANQFGAHISHPGGTPYRQKENGQVEFLHKGDPRATGVTAPHQIDIPARDFMGPGLVVAESNTRPIAAALVPLLNQGKVTPEQILEAMGPTATAAFKQAITNIHEPPNKASTVRAKGSDHPLIGTTLMRNSITHQVRKV